MQRKTFSVCDIEKYIRDFYKKYAGCKNFKGKRGSKPYHEN